MIQGLARACWAAVQAEPGAGRTMKASPGAVWHPFPQTSQAGEWLEAAAAIQAARGEGNSTLDLDCQSVLRGLTLQGPKVLDHKTPWAGVRRSLIGGPGLKSIKE